MNFKRRLQSYNALMRAIKRKNESDIATHLIELNEENVSHVRANYNGSSTYLSTSDFSSNNHLIKNNKALFLEI